MRISARLLFPFVASLMFQVGAQAAPFRVGLVIDAGGKGDKGFNNAAWTGIERAREALNLTTVAAEVTPSKNHEALLRNFAKQKFDLVIAPSRQAAARASVARAKTAKRLSPSPRLFRSVPSCCSMMAAKPLHPSDIRLSAAAD